MMQQEPTIHPTSHPTNDEEASTIESNGSGFFWILCGIIATVIVVCIAIFCIVVILRYKSDKRTSQQSTNNLKSIHVQNSPLPNNDNSKLENKGSNISSVNNNVINGDVREEQYSNNDPNMWRCRLCTYLNINDMNKNRCDLCLTDKPKKYIVTSGHVEVEDENNIIKQQNERLMIKHWLNRIGLIKYLDVFVENGYDCLQIIKEITNCDGLIDIGIINEQHQKQLMFEINKLKLLIHGNQSVEHQKAMQPLPDLFKALPKAPSEVHLSGHHTARMSMDENGVPDLLNVKFQSELNLYHEGIQNNHNNNGAEETKNDSTKI